LFNAHSRICIVVAHGSGGGGGDGLGGDSRGVHGGGDGVDGADKEIGRNMRRRKRSRERNLDAKEPQAGRQAGW
jgi:hypothetical protein